MFTTKRGACVHLSSSATDLVKDSRIHYTVVQTLLYGALISKPGKNEKIMKTAFFDSGFVFRQPDYTVVAVNHLQKCWEMYKNYCKNSAATRSDETMTCRDLLWMFKVHYINIFFY